jgi:hypothetical protein
MNLDRRLARLERALPAPPVPRPRDERRHRRWLQVARRCDSLLDAAWPLLAEEEQDRVTVALTLMTEDRAGPYAEWMRHLAKGWCRLPELSADAMKSLLLAWLSPDVEGSMVCRVCGLELPRHKYPPLSQWKLLPGREPLEGPAP